MKRRLRLTRRLHRYRAAIEQQHRGAVLAAQTRLLGVHRQIAQTVQALERAGREWRPDGIRGALVRAYLDGLRAQLDVLLQEEAQCRRELAEAQARHGEAWRDAKLAERLRLQAERAYQRALQWREANELDDAVLRLRAIRSYRSRRPTRPSKPEFSDR